MKKDFWMPFAIAFVFLTLGILLLKLELVGYGISFFVFLPFVLGFALGNDLLKKISIYGLIGAFVIFLALLIAGGIEGMICVLMAMPIVIVAVALGFLVRYFVNKRKSSKSNTLKTSAVPFCVFLIFGVTENLLRQDPVVVHEVTSEIILPYTSFQVYDAIKFVDTLDAETPFLMKLDLPIPQKCVLEEEKVGGIRTCYFEGGRIVERITALERGALLKMDVIDYQLTGRKWLGFRQAIYTFEEIENNYCKMTRTTTYTSELYPRFYWRPLEELGIRQEHDFVFSDLEKDLFAKHGKSQKQ